RGLRKHNSKDFVTIIDFIGNYKNNYLIPVALSGDQSQNKDNIRRRLSDTSYIKGVSTVLFENIAKEQIYKSINNTNLTQLSLLKEAFEKLKNRIGRIPFLLDFMENKSLDPVAIISEHENYYVFLKKIRQDVQMINDYENKVLTMVSQELLNGKRKHELLLLESLIKAEKITEKDFIAILKINNCRTDIETIASAYRVLNLKFFTSGNKKKYGDEPLINHLNNEIVLNDKFGNAIRNNPYFLHFLQDVILSGLEKSSEYNISEKLTLFKKYSRKDACKLLNWDQDESSTMYGYKVKHQTCPIFVTYHKHDEVESSVAYGEEFIDRNIFKWFTRSNRSLNSQEVQKIIHAKENNIDIHFFIKKDNGEGNDFYYLGEAKVLSDSIAQQEMFDKSGKTLPVVTMNMQFENSVNNKLFHYLRSETIS
ncbi:MAG: DUF3427 domain-containing protein, partial [Paenisporosarcina sp.]